MFQRIGQAAYKADLNNTFILDEHLDHPHKYFKTIHVAGTNGKGSVSHMLAAVLQKAGYRTGLYTSPHLKDFRERIKINGRMIPENEVVRFVNENKNIIDQVQPSFFEMTVALAFSYFFREKVDIAVIETGLGGRLDSTNIINPLVSVITNIGLDHTQFLGNTLEKIAAEKAGIIKPHIPVIVGEYQVETYPVFNEYAEGNNSSLVYADQKYKTISNYLVSENEHVLTIQSERGIIHVATDLPGNYQTRNIPTVLQTIDSLREGGLKISERSVLEGISEVRRLTGLRGRWEVIGKDPLLVCDTAHNREGLSMVFRQIKQTPYKKLHVILGIVKDKDIHSILPVLLPEAEYYFTQAAIPRAMDHKELKDAAAMAGLYGFSYPSVTEAINAAKRNADKEDMIFIGGSTFVVAEALT